MINGCGISLLVMAVQLKKQSYLLGYCDSIPQVYDF